MTKFELTKMKGSESWRLVFLDDQGFVRDIYEAENPETLLRTFVHEMLPKEFIEAVNVERRKMRQKLL